MPPLKRSARKHWNSETLRRAARTRFGISRFRPGQQDVIESVLAGRDTLAIMPSGGGKSLCYQLPALLLDGITVVVSPLIALMQDQVDKLDEAGVEADQLNSTLTARAEAEALERIDESESRFVFTTPERLADTEFIETLKQSKIDLLVIDEAHCISQWGHDFRPAFLAIGAAIETLGKPTVLALTATATGDVANDIRTQLGTPQMRIINTGVYRANLHYAVRQTTNEEEKRAVLRDLLRVTKGSVIVYAATVKAVESLCEHLAETGERVTHYHGRLAAKIRLQNQNAFMNDEARIMIATNAFGMGIDKADIRAVIHYQIPASLEAYYQESGRAGRDGADADCVLLYYHKDKHVQQFFLLGRYPDRSDIEALYDALRRFDERGESPDLPTLRDALPQLAKSKMQVALKQLRDGGLLERTGRGLRLRPRDDAQETLAALACAYEERTAHDRETLERMVYFAQSGLCRWRIMLEYFGEVVEWDRCGTCDNCLHPPEAQLAAAPSPSSGKRRPKVHKPPFAAGATVTVPRFGLGEVKAVAGNTVSIAFPDGTLRSFLAGYVKPAHGEAKRG